MTNTLHTETDRSTSTTTDAATTDVERRRRRSPFDLSATQLLAAALAATTATFAASYLGVAGTVIGAALASVVTTIGNAVYGHSLRSTRARVREVVPRRGAPVAGPSGEDDTDVRAPALPSPVPHTPGERGWRRIAIASIAVFVAVLAVVTGVEIVAGRPLSDIVRGDAGHGTSLFGEPAGTTSPVPTVTRTVIPSVTVVTPTVTQTAPAVTQTTTPTVTATPSPSTAGSTAVTSPTGSATTASSGTPNPRLSRQDRVQPV